MFPSELIALLSAISATAWVYAKMERRVGVKSTAAIAAGCAGALAFIVVYLIALAIRNALS